MRTTPQHPAGLAEAAELGQLRYTIMENAEGEMPVAQSAAWMATSDEIPIRPLTEFPRLSDAFFAAARHFASRPALITRQRTYSYVELAHQARCVAHYLLSDSSYHPGDRVAVMLDNGPEFIAALYGILAAGGVSVPLPANVEQNRLEQIAGICGIRMILSSRRIIRKRAELAGNACETLDLSTGSSQTVPTVSPLRVANQTLAMILFTSGSSGDPKGVMLSDGNLLANTESILQYLPITQDDRALALLPFYHAFGLSVLQTHLLSGATLVVDGNMAFPNTAVDALARHRATSFSAVPDGYHSLMSMSDLRDRELPYLRYMTVAGGALKSNAVVEVAQSISPAEFYVMYGQTEASARLACLPAHLAQSHPDSIGQAIPGVELRILDLDGHEAAENETGELCARGANVMLGYWNDEPGTSKVLRQGWLRTGDLASRDAAGHYYVKSRKNDLVKVQGFRVHPREVEDAVAQHFPSLRVIVVPYQRGSTTRLALYGITKKWNQQLANDLRRVCVRELPRHKIPTYVEVTNQAPLNASMKLDRTALKRRAEMHAGLEPESASDPCPLRKLSA
jgi:long-chain acyl-CoA synthetase